MLVLAMAIVKTLTRGIDHKLPPRTIDVSITDQKKSLNLLGGVIVGNYFP